MASPMWMICLAQLCMAANGILELIFLELLELEYSRTNYLLLVLGRFMMIGATHMFQGSKYSVHLPNRIIDLKVQRLKDQVKQNIWIRRNVFPSLSAHKIGDSLPQSLRRPKAHESRAPI